MTYVAATESSQREDFNDACKFPKKITPVSADAGRNTRKPSTAAGRGVGGGGRLGHVALRCEGGGPVYCELMASLVPRALCAGRRPLIWSLIGRSNGLSWQRVQLRFNKRGVADRLAQRPPPPISPHPSPPTSLQSRQHRSLRLFGRMGRVRRTLGWYTE